MPLQATSGAASYDAFGGGVAAVPQYIEDVFSTYLYTGNNSTQVINNGIDLAGKGGLVWLKRRNAATSHVLSDSARGLGSSVYRQLFTDLTSAQNSTTTEGISSFGSGGFTLTKGSDVNALNNPYASWTFRKQPKFFDVVTWTGTGTVSHNLGSTPGFWVYKNTGSTGNWFALARKSDGTYEALYLNQTSATVYTGANAAAVGLTSTTFDPSLVFGSAAGQSYVGYAFAHNAGGFGLTGTDNVISCGSYTGNGSASGPTVTLGYEPQWVMIKNASSTGAWLMLDVMRGFIVGDGYTGVAGSADARLFANLSSAEDSGYNRVDPTSTGFKLTDNSSEINSNGATYIYIAIRRGPMKVPTSGTSVFSPLKSTTTFTAGNTTGTLLSDWMWGRPRLSEGSLNWFQSSRLTPRTMAFNGATAEDATQYVGFDTQTGVRWVNTWTSTAGNYGSWYFRRAPNFFDVVCYTGTGTYGALKHNLGVIPEWIIGKPRSATGDWIVVYLNSPTNLRYVTLNSSSASANWGSALNTSTEFYGTDDASGTKYVHYLFATCAGVSKVGSYTGNGSSQTINCGFTSGARFVLIKSTSAAGHWRVYDTARGIVAGNEPELFLNLTNAEQTVYDAIDTDSSGFIVNSNGANVNDSGVTYIFLAIA